ncbi:MAG TPA: DUF1638 domain-containing protein [Negativicutes bacterium]
MKTLILACNMLKDELNKAIIETECKYPLQWVDTEELHLEPMTLKEHLQKELDAINGFDRVLLAFGYCGNALLGLKPPSFSLIFPKVDDCITLCLGSCERRKEISDEMGTYFYTKGWMEYKHNIWNVYQHEFPRLADRYGKERAEKVWSKMLPKQYKRLGIIETGAYELGEVLKKAETMATNLNLCYQVIPGTTAYIEKLLTGQWDEEFITIYPGETVTFERISLKPSQQ